MDNIRLFAKNEKELVNIIQAMGIYTEEVGMEFGTEKCAMIITKKRKTTSDGWNKTTKWRKKPNSRRKGSLKYLGILEADTIKQVKIK